MRTMPRAAFVLSFLAKMFISCARSSVVLVFGDELAHRGNHRGAFGAGDVEHRAGLVAEDQQSESEPRGHVRFNRGGDLAQLLLDLRIANFKRHRTSFPLSPPVKI